MAHTTTMPAMWHDLVSAQTIKSEYCVICGKPANNQHHIIPRSAGQFVDKLGRVHSSRKNADVKTPTVTLCGSGNTSGCHGMAHNGQLHFRVKDIDPDIQKCVKNGNPAIIMHRLEYLVTEPCERLDALEKEGWCPVVKQQAKGK